MKTDKEVICPKCGREMSVSLNAEVTCLGDVAGKRHQAAKMVEASAATIKKEAGFKAEKPKIIAKTSKYLRGVKNLRR